MYFQDEDTRRRNDLGRAARQGCRGRQAVPSRHRPHRRSPPEDESESGPVEIADNSSG